MNLEEKQIERQEIFNGRVLHVVCDKVALPNGHTSTREFVLHNGAVCVIPITDDGKVVLERQYRYAVGRVVTEIPAGKLDPGEDPLECAKRELKEETGYTADEYIHIGEYYGSPAILCEHINMYLARGLHKGDIKLDEDEFLEVFEIPLDDLVDMVMENKIVDAKTQLCAIKAKIWLDREKAKEAE